MFKIHPRVTFNLGLSVWSPWIYQCKSACYLPICSECKIGDEAIRIKMNICHFVHSRHVTSAWLPAASAGRRLQTSRPLLLWRGNNVSVIIPSVRLPLSCGQRQGRGLDVKLFSVLSSPVAPFSRRFACEHCVFCPRGDRCLYLGDKLHGEHKNREVVFCEKRCLSLKRIEEQSCLGFCRKSRVSLTANRVQLDLVLNL